MKLVPVDNQQFPLVSVVVPAYNAEKWLGQCIASILGQDYPSIELIIVDDGSTDKTYYLASRFRDAVLIHFTENKGEFKASRAGFAIAKGKYICRLSADDYYIAGNHISEQVKNIEKTGADWCYNSSYLKGIPEGQWEKVYSMWMPLPFNWLPWFFNRFDNWFLSHPYLAFCIFIRRNPVNSSTLMIRQTAYEQVIYPGEWRTDWDSQVLISLLLNKKKGIALNEIGSFYRIHPEQESNNPRYKNDMKEIRICALEGVASGDYPLWLKLGTRLLKQ